MSLLQSLWGHKRLQGLFEWILKVALRGLNYGRASDYHHNGELYAIRYVRDQISSSASVLFDVGGNKGAFTKHLLEAWQGLNYQIYVFEPSAKTFEVLRSALLDRPYLHLINLGLGETPGKTELFYDKEGSGLASVYHRDLSHRDIDFSGRESIELTTLDIFCEKQGITSIDFLKLDVEGHELSVLKGAKRMFAERRIRIVQFEFGGCNIDSRTYFRDYYNFFSGEFQLYRILSNGLRRIEKYSERLEIFESANYLAIRF